VTNPERFAPLHEIAADLLDRLEQEFEVERAEGYGLDPEVEGKLTALARPTVVLTPQGAGAPLAVSFSTFPGIHVRVGRWYTRPFPACGCDACEETAETEAEYLKWLTESAVEGRFREAIQILDFGQAWRSTEVWSASGRSERSDSALDVDEARRLIAALGRSSFDWQPWIRRTRSV
jgi:hypothetical protein